MEKSKRRRHLQILSNASPGAAFIKSHLVQLLEKQNIGRIGIIT
jgi:hypothetical protein